MTYQATLNGTQQITISNQGRQTQITLMASSPGQQQSQSSSFTTGIWINPPQLFNTAQGFILQINAEQGKNFIQIQANGISTIKGIPSLQDATSIELETVGDRSGQADLKFEPMQPMKMGNMSMDINSMSMQMGDMSLNLGNKSKSTVSKTFCSQCGIEAKNGDRFCRSCGHNLSQ